LSRGLPKLTKNPIAFYENAQTDKTEYLRKTLISLLLEVATDWGPIRWG
jgi:hypothetical protein